MKITACNLRSIGKEKCIDICDKIVLSGINGAGKSTMAKVPYFVLTGKGLSLKNGTSEGYGVIEFSDIAIMRQKKKNGTVVRVNGKVCSEVAMKEHLNKIGYNPDALIALFDTETTLDGETMLKVASMRLDIDKVLSFTNLDDNDKHTVSRYFQENDVELVSIPVINKAHNRFYSLRTDVNREIKRLRTLVENDEPFAKVQPIDVAQQVQANTVLVEEQRKLVLSISSAENLVERKSKLDKQIAAWRTEKMLLEAKDCPFSQEDIKKAEDKIAELEQKNLAYTAEINRLNGIVLALTEELSGVRIQKSKTETLLKQKNDTITTLTTTTVCPLYAGVSCTTNMQVVIDTLNAEVAELNKTVQDIEAKRLDLTVNIDDNKQLLEEMQNALMKNKNEMTEK